MPKKKEKNFIIRSDVYPFDIMVSIGETDEEFLKSVTKKFPASCLDIVKSDSILTLPFGQIARTLHLTNTYHTLIRLKKLPQNALEKGAFAHEIFHCTHFLFDTLGITLTVSSGEAYAYFIGFLTTEIYKRI